MSAPAESDIHLSIVATSRNDDHGGSLTRRTQHFVDGLVAQCRRHGLRAELILVEWNPPPDRVPLIQELRWPADPGPCDIRIVTVPPEVHRTFDHADRMGLFQMLAKNAGIRRARGKFLLATNIDILFSDEAIRFLRDRLRPGYLYLADRVDVPADVPASRDFGEVLSFCERQAFRVNTGALAVERGSGNWRVRDRIKTALGARGSYVMDIFENYFALAGRTLRNPRWVFRRVLGHGLAASAPQIRESRAAVPLLLASGAWEIARRMGAGVAESVLQLNLPFTNACGDFTVMSREDWLQIRGYSERAMYSWHLDSLLVHQAVGRGIRAKRLAPGAHVFHIDHGGGYTPQQAAALFKRLDAKGIPYLTDNDLRRLHDDIFEKKRSGQDIQFNDPGWGLSGLPLPEVRPGSV